MLHEDDDTTAAAAASAKFKHAFISSTLIRLGSRKNEDEKEVMTVRETKHVRERVLLEGTRSEQVRVGLSSWHQRTGFGFSSFNTTRYLGI